MGILARGLAASLALTVLLCLAPIPARAASAARAGMGAASAVRAAEHVTGGGTELEQRGEAASRWLRNNMGGTDAGQEQAVYALLKGGYTTRVEPFVKTYVRQLIDYWPEGATHADLPRAVWQAMVLQAAEVNVSRQVPALIAALTDVEALEAEGYRAKAMVLLAFGTGGLPLPADKREAFEEMALELLAIQQYDGAFWDPSMTDTLATALAVQALAGWTYLPGVDAAVVRATGYLANWSTAGGVTENGAPSPYATAHTALALSCLGADPDDLGGLSLTEALFQYQDAEGGFALSPGGQPFLDLTALCTLALSSVELHGEGAGTIFSFGPPATQPTGATPVSTVTGVYALDVALHSLSDFLARLTGVRLPAPTPVALLTLLGVILIFICVAAGLYHRRDRRRARREKRKMSTEK